MNLREHCNSEAEAPNILDHRGHGMPCPYDRDVTFSHSLMGAALITLRHFLGSTNGRTRRSALPPSPWRKARGLQGRVSTRLILPSNKTVVPRS
jgi:hypothetical protein